ncbi:TPA: hypothetical protein ACH3X3_012062 [Trebouxia sp. C0006]
MTPQAAHSADRGDKVLLADQFLDCTKPQLLAVWKELNPDGYEPASKRDLQRFFIERYGDYRQHMCTSVPFAVHRKRPSTASNSQQEENFPPIVSKPAEDLPQRLSYSKAVQRSPDGMDRKQRECDERLIKLEKTSKAYDRQFEEISRDHKSFNLVMYNIPEEGEKAKNRFEAIKTVAKEFDAAVEVAMSEYTVDEETMKTVLPTTIERIGQFTADRTKPRPVRLVFSTLLQKHGFLRMAKVLRQAGFRLDDALTRSQQAERKTLSLDFQDLKIKGYQPYFRGSLLQYYSNNKVHTCAKGKADKVRMNM